MEIEPQRRRILDEEHLRLLALFHYISGGLTILFSSFFIIHLMVMGLLLNTPGIFGAHPPAQGPDPQQVLSVVFTVFAVFIVLGIAFGIAQIVSGRFMAKRRRRTFSFIVALPNLLLIPYGTLLGVFTLIVLGRESVKSLYAENAQTPS